MVASREILESSNCGESWLNDVFGYWMPFGQGRHLTIATDTELIMRKILEFEVLIYSK